MESANQELYALYGGKIRVRACGILIENDKILVTRHKMPAPTGFFVSPPGGGVNFGERLEEAVKREFQEETGLYVEVGELLFVNQFIGIPLHGVELFFKITSWTGNLASGADPEFSEYGQILKNVSFMTLGQIQSFPSGSVHSIFCKVRELRELFELSGLL